RELGHDRLGLVGAEPEAGEPGAEPGLPLGGPEPPDMLQGRLVEVKLVHLVLGEIADPELRGPRDGPRLRRKFPGKELGKRGFSLAVATEERDPVVLVDPEAQAPEDRQAAIA